LLLVDSADRITRELWWTNQGFSPAVIIPPWFSMLIYHVGLNNRPFGGRCSERQCYPIDMIITISAHSVYISGCVTSHVLQSTAVTNNSVTVENIVKTCKKIAILIFEYMKIIVCWRRALSALLLFFTGGEGVWKQ
jgi:hypothetical protein